MTWHVHDDLLAEYGQGRLDLARVMSVEAHVARCARCRRAVPADPGWLAASWESVLDAVDQPTRLWWERLLTGVGVPDHRVRLLAATPALRRSWLLANAAVLAFAALAAVAMDVTDPRRLVVFLGVAPVLPVLAVAGAYGPGVDRLHEIASATPAAGGRLLLWRASAVLVASIGLCAAASMVASAFLPGAGWSAAAWLLPALALSAGTLALGTVVPIRVAAAGLGWCWVTGVAVAALWYGDLRAVAGATAQLCYVGAAVLAGAALILRRRRLDPGAPR
jgi:hypothetical protein